MLKGTKKVELGEVKANAELDQIAEHVIEQHKDGGDAVTHHYKIRRQEELSITVVDDRTYQGNQEAKDTTKKKKSSWCSCFGK